MEFSESLNLKHNLQEFEHVITRNTMKDGKLQEINLLSYHKNLSSKWIVSIFIIFITIVNSPNDQMFHRHPKFGINTQKMSQTNNPPFSTTLSCPFKHFAFLFFLSTTVLKTLSWNNKYCVTLAIAKKIPISIYQAFKAKCEPHNQMKHKFCICEYNVFKKIAGREKVVQIFEAPQAQI